MTIKNCLTIFLCLLVLSTSVINVSASKGQDGLWREVDDTYLSRRPSLRTPTPENYKTFKLEKTELARLLSTVPDELSLFAATQDQAEKVIELPMPDGKLARFRFEHSLVVEPGLVAKYPELASTYRGYGIDDPTATARFDILPSGFHAIVLSSSGTVLIDPYAAGDSDNYVAYLKNDLQRGDDFKCEVGESTLDSLLNPDLFDSREFVPDSPTVTSGSQLRTYRLALAASNEYAVRVGGNTIAGTLAAQVLIMNRVNGVYERDLAIHMNIVADNDKIVYAGDNMSCPVGTGGTACTAANDPYTNSSGSTMLGENVTNLNTIIETANYDIGHVFSTGGGGIAGVGVPCNSSKARGVTGLGNPVGDAFAIDYVAHEMGHQWGANHTFNGTTSSCGGGNRFATSAYEPGSGVTIMAYAGICGNQNLARNSIDTFHVRSLEAITTYSQGGGGSVCAQITASGNTPPDISVVGGPTFNIPKQTPFTLTASATDTNGDTITYDWQEYDLGASTTAVPNTDDTGVKPIFRPYYPTTSPSRTFPSMQYILANANVPPPTFNCSGFACLTGELLPQIARTMTFQVIARDNRANAGGVNTATATVVVDANGPFAVTSPNTSTPLFIGTNHTLTWSVAGTAEGVINAANVKISLSTDGGLTFPTVLLASTRNDGSETILVPNIVTSTARIKIEAIGNIFFDISDTNFAIAPIPPFTAVSGRVLTPTGLPVRNAKVTLTDSLGNKQLATTGTVGSFTFGQVPTAGVYTLTVSSKRYRFAPQILNVGYLDLAASDLIGLE